MSRAWFKEVLSHYSLLSVSFLPDTVLRLGEQTPKRGGALGDSSLTAFPNAPPPSPQPQLIGQEAGPGPGEVIYWQLSRACQILPGEFEQGGVGLLGPVSQWFSEEQRKKAEKKKRERERQIIEKSRGERNKSFLRKILGVRAPGVGFPRDFRIDKAIGNLLTLEPLRWILQRSTNVHTHMCTYHTCTPFYFFFAVPLPHLNNFQNGKSQRRLNLLSGCKSWETEMNRSEQQNFWRGQREEVADCLRENTGAQISWGIS